MIYLELKINISGAVYSKDRERRRELLSSRYYVGHFVQYVSMHSTEICGLFIISQWAEHNFGREPEEPLLTLPLVATVGL